MFTLKRLWLDRDPQALKLWTELMVKAHLDPNEKVEYTVGIFSGNQLAATGSFDRNIIKCVVVCKDFQSENLLTQLIMHLMAKMREESFTHVLVYTKPGNEEIFHSLGFQPIIASSQILFMEQSSPNFNDYLNLLRHLKKEGLASSIVMNANPFTKGHQYLVEYAAKNSNQVYVFVVSEDRSEFTTEERLDMVKLGVAHLPNVTVVPTKDYLVSSATFPSYFLKDQAEMTVAKIQAEVDSRLFKERIAPVLTISKRFVGEEPFSEVTEIYNQSMREIFADKLELIVLPRKEIKGTIISATKVREAIKNHEEQLLLDFLPKTTYDYLKEHKKI
ncbi:[citrate (pro-3S)-lyase] ligase [Enterococcus songbeiensis]